MQALSTNMTTVFFLSLSLYFLSQFRTMMKKYSSFYRNKIITKHIPHAHQAKDTFIHCFYPTLWLYAIKIYCKFFCKCPCRLFLFIFFSLFQLLIHMIRHRSTVTATTKQIRCMLNRPMCDDILNMNSYFNISWLNRNFIRWIDLNCELQLVIAYLKYTQTHTRYTIHDKYNFNKQN